jgi:hypothetical protein
MSTWLNFLKACGHRRARGHGVPGTGIIFYGTDIGTNFSSCIRVNGIYIRAIFSLDNVGSDISKLL